MSDETEAKSNGATNGSALKTRSKRRGLVREESAADANGQQTVIAEQKPIDPVVEPTPEAPPAPAPVQVAAAVGPAWYRRIDQPKIKTRDPKDGWEEGRSALLFTAEANGWEPISVLCTDIRVWGQLGEALICRSKDAIVFRMPDGEMWRAPAGTTFAVLAVNELMHVLDKMESNPDACIEADIYPIAERRMETGLWTVHYRVIYRIVPGLSRKEAWRG